MKALKAIFCDWPQLSQIKKAQLSTGDNYEYEVGRCELEFAGEQKKTTLEFLYARQIGSIENYDTGVGYCSDI